MWEIYPDHQDSHCRLFLANCPNGQVEVDGQCCKYDEVVINGECVCQGEYWFGDCVPCCCGWTVVHGICISCPPGMIYYGGTCEKCPDGQVDADIWTCVDCPNGQIAVSGVCQGT